MVSVILCTYNRGAMLKDMLASFARLSLPPDLEWELLLMDNNSNDNTREVAEAFAHSFSDRVRYFFEPRTGKSFALNSALRLAKGDILAFTDDDVELHPQWLVQLAKTFKETDCMAVAGRILPLWKKPKPRWFTDEPPHSMGAPIVQFDLGDTMRQIQRSPWGANMALKREAFRKYGVFRTDLGRTGRLLLSSEETELFQRIFQGNEVVVYAPAALVYHIVGEERLRRSYFQSFYYWNGKSEVRTTGIPPHAVCYFGVPRYLFRMLAEHAAAWSCSFRPKLRFYHKLEAYFLVGQILEYYRLRHALKPGVAKNQDVATVA